MTIEELLKDAKDWWKQHAEREMEKKETLVSRFETAVKRMEQLHTLVSVDKRWSIKVSNKIPAVPWRNDISASGLMISPQNGTDLANVSISANGVTYTFPAGSTAATVIPLGLPGDVITISGTSATMAVMDLRALGQEETLRFLMRPFGSTVIVGNTVNAQLTGSNAPLPANQFVAVNQAITDTNSYSVTIDRTSMPSLATATKKILGISNSGSQPVTLSAFGFMKDSPNGPNGGNLTTPQVSVGANNSYYFTETSISWFDEAWDAIVVYYQYTTASTGGNLWIGMRTLG